MGWVWTDDEPASHGSSSSSTDTSDFRMSSFDSSSGDGFSTRKVVKTQCRTDETEPGKFIRKCQKTEEIFKDCVGRPAEMVQSTKEYSEEDVTGQMAKGALSLDYSQDFNFPGPNWDIEAMARGLFDSIGRSFEAAEEMKNAFFNVFGAPVTPRAYDGDSSSATKSRGIPIDRYPPKEVLPEHSKSDGDVDLSGLARDI